MTTVQPKLRRSHGIVCFILVIVILVVVVFVVVVIIISIVLLLLLLLLLRLCLEQIIRGAFDDGRQDFVLVTGAIGGVATIIESHHDGKR